jgi:hypothetical protein
VAALGRQRQHSGGFAKKKLQNKNLAKKNQTHEELNFGRHPMLTFYKKHNLDGKSLLFDKETQVKFFFEVVFGKLKCDCWCLHF